MQAAGRFALMWRGRLKLASLAMTSPALQSFVARAAALSQARTEPADCVLALAPLMLELVEQAGSFLQPRTTAAATWATAAT